MTDSDLIAPEDSLERQNQKLRIITRSLMHRVEQETDQAGNAYSLFQRSIALEAEVRARTQDLQRTLGALKKANDDLELARAEAEAASRAKSRFLAAASHDLVQPLNAAKLFLGSLRASDLAPAEARIAANLASSLKSLETLLGAVLDISRLDQPAIEPRLGPVAVRTVLDPVVNEFRPIAAANGLVLRYVPGSAMVQSDPTYLRQIVQNLVANAVRYTGQGCVLVGCRRVGGGIRIEVHDTGPGIAPEHQAEIFREFHQIAANGEGMGLGLAIVERACRLLSHRLELTSTLGRGTCFAVTLPLAERTGLSDARTGLVDKLVMIVTADANLGGSLGPLIEGWGADVIMVSDPSEIASVVDQTGILPDVLLADLAHISPAEIACQAEALSVPGHQLRTVHLLSEGMEPIKGSASVVRPVRPHRLRALLSLPRGA